MQLLRPLQAGFLLLSLAALANATPVPPSQIQFVGAPTGVNDGQFYVLPYQIRIDGNLTLVTCYDSLDEVSPGDTWQANLLNVSDAANFGYFSGKINSLSLYERIAWLSSRTYSNVSQQIGLQHAIWNVFGSAAMTADATTYANAADTEAAGGYSGFSFSTFRFIEQVGGVPGSQGTKQAFVFRQPLAPMPEPGAMAQLAGGVLLTLAAGRYFNHRQS